MNALAGVLLSVLALVALGAVVPVLPTGPVVSGAAAFAEHQEPLTVPLVVLAGALGAYIGDLVLYAMCRWGGDRLAERLRWLRTDPRSVAVLTRLERHQVSVLLISRMLPAGRIPVLVGGALAGWDWHRFALANVPACLLWATLYTCVGLVGSAFTQVWQAVLAAVAAAAVVGLAVERYRRISSARRSARH